MTYFPALGIEITGNPNHLVLHGVMNPLTRTAIKLVPPIEINSSADYEGFQAWVSAYCEECWTILIDPAVIDGSGWREGHPSCA